MIAVTFALPAESSEFVARLQRRARANGIVSGTLHGRDVQVIHTGVGRKAAQATIGKFLQTQRPASLVSAGFAGALDSRLPVAALLLARNFSAPALLKTARSVLPHAQVGNLASARTMLDSAADRAAFARENDAIAVDMETERISAACAGRNVPMISLRAISDTPGAPFPAPPAVLFDLEMQRTNYTALLAYFARQPSAIFRLIAFARQITLARKALTTALDRMMRAQL